MDHSFLTAPRLLAKLSNCKLLINPAAAQAMKNTPKVNDSSIDFVSMYIIPATDNRIIANKINVFMTLEYEYVILGLSFSPFDFFPITLIGTYTKIKIIEQTIAIAQRYVTILIVIFHV